MEIEMQVQNLTALSVLDDARRLHVGELTQVGETLSEDEMKAVAGAQMSVSWTCGSQSRADEWNVSQN
jgi:hypothetical protein